MTAKTAITYDVKWDRDGWERPQEIYSVQKTQDLITKVRIIRSEGLAYIDIRDWIVSQDCWGRGYWINADPAVMNALAVSLIEAADKLERTDG